MAEKRCGNCASSTACNVRKTAYLPCGCRRDEISESRTWVWCGDPRVRRRRPNIGVRSSDALLRRRSDAPCYKDCRTERE
jgi:hypothetical protein